MEGSGEAGVAFCDLPALPPGPVGKFMLTRMAAVAEPEAGLISQRTKAALVQARARGVKLGNPRLCAGSRESARAAAAASDQARRRAADVAPYIAQARVAGARTLRQIAGALNARGVRAPRDGAWYPTSVKRVLAYAEVSRSGS